MRRSAGLRPSGRRRAGLCARRRGRWAASAPVTERIKVGTGVINLWTRNVGLMAATFVTLDDLAPGRVLLGIGAWWEPLASKVGVQRESPLRAMREMVEVVRRLS